MVLAYLMYVNVLCLESEDQGEQTLSRHRGFLNGYSINFLPLYELFTTGCWKYH